METWILKIAISVITVVALAEVAKRVDPVLSGILLGLPLGAGLAVYFITSEQGIEFMVAGIPWAIAGLAASLLFCTVYLLVATWISLHRLMTIGISSIAALGAFFISGSVIRGLDLIILTGTLLFLTVAGVNVVILRLLVENQTVKKSRPLRLKGLLLRGFIAGLIILGVTIMAPLAGSRWAGILSSFPATLYALLVIVHYETGKALFPSIILGFAYGVPALAVFYLACLILLPRFGLNQGFIMVYGISAGYLYLTHWVIHTIQRKGRV